jgi:hypothetical protein
MMRLIEGIVYELTLKNFNFLIHEETLIAEFKSH